MSVGLHIATSRDVGERCKLIAQEMGISLVGMDECDVFVSVLYERLISQDYIQTRPCFNFHPGILPWYRGAGAYSWAIINGEFEAGVTLHEIDQDIDHGSVIAIERFPILPTDTAGSLFSKAEDTITSMFRTWIVRLLMADYQSVDQVDGKIYYRRDLEKAKDITKFIRAFTFPGKEDAFYVNEHGEKRYVSYS